MQMATSTFPIFFFISILLLLLLPFLYAQTTPKPQALVFPIKKDDNTSQYFTSIRIGSNSTKFNVVIDLGGRFLWFNSLPYLRAAASYRPILCGSQQSSIVEGPGCTNCSNPTPPVPGCTNNTSTDFALNPFSGAVQYNGLGLDVMRVYSTRGDQYKVNDFAFQFSDSNLRVGLSNLTLGMIGLGRTKLSLQAHIASAFNISQKFALCIPSSNNDGNLIIGETTYKKPFSIISNSLFTTPLIRNPVSTWGDSVIGNYSIQYFINLKSIKVGDTSLAFNKSLLSINKKSGGGGTCIRTVKAYTSLEGSIYTALINEFVKAAANKSIKRVASVAPFGACFDSKTITTSKTGPDVPTIDLVLQSNKVYWRFYGSNSMVRVGNEVMCLAFVEGEQKTSIEQITSIVVGGYQMENYLVEFDVASSTLRFSSSLLLHDTSCSNFGGA